MIERAYEIHGRQLRVSSELESSIEVLDGILALYRVSPSTAPTNAAKLLRIAVQTEGSDFVAAPEGRDVGHTDDGTEFVVDAQGGLHAFAPEVGRAEINPERSFADIRLGSARTGQRWRHAHRLVYPAMMELLKATGLFSIHASAVAHAGGGLLLCGPSGSAKSTLSLALARVGLGLLSDDTCFVEREPGGRIAIRAFWEDLHLTEQTLDLLRAEDVRAVAVGRPGSEKWFVPLAQLPGIQKQESVTPRWLVFPGFVEDRATTLSPLTRGAAMGRLVRQSLVPTADRHARAQFDLLAALCETTECLQLRMGGSPAEAVQCLLERLGQAPAEI